LFTNIPKYKDQNLIVCEGLFTSLPIIVMSPLEDTLALTSTHAQQEKGSVHYATYFSFVVCQSNSSIALKNNLYSFGRKLCKNWWIFLGTTPFWLIGSIKQA